MVQAMVRRAEEETFKPSQAEINVRMTQRSERQGANQHLNADRAENQEVQPRMCEPHKNANERTEGERISEKVEELLQWVEAVSRNWNDRLRCVVHFVEFP